MSFLFFCVVCTYSTWVFRNQHKAWGWFSNMSDKINPSHMKKTKTITYGISCTVQLQTLVINKVFLWSWYVNLPIKTIFVDHTFNLCHHEANNTQQIYQIKESLYVVLYFWNSFVIKIKVFRNYALLQSYVVNRKW